MGNCDRENFSEVCMDIGEHWAAGTKAGAGASAATIGDSVLGLGDARSRDVGRTGLSFEAVIEAASAVVVGCMCSAIVLSWVSTPVS